MIPVEAPLPEKVKDAQVELQIRADAISLMGGFHKAHVRYVWGRELLLPRILRVSGLRVQSDERRVNGEGAIP